MLCVRVSLVFFTPWPNARRELRLEVGATQERTLEAVSSTPLFGPATPRCPDLFGPYLPMMRSPARHTTAHVLPLLCLRGTGAPNALRRCLLGPAPPYNGMLSPACRGVVYPPVKRWLKTVASSGLPSKVILPCAMASCARMRPYISRINVSPSQEKVTSADAGPAPSR